MTGLFYNTEIADERTFVFSRQFPEYKRLKMVTIQQLGCWKFQLLRKNWLWGLILPNITSAQIYTGMLSCTTSLHNQNPFNSLPVHLFSYKLMLMYAMCIRRNKALIEDLSRPPPGSKDLYFPTQFSQSSWIQFVACLWKQHWSYWRNPPYTAVRFFFTAFIALLFGSLFWDLGGRT